MTTLIVVMDRPVVEAATLSAPCPVFLEAEEDEEAQPHVEACLDPDAGADGVSGECGFTAYGFNLTQPSFAQSTVVCVSGAWMLLNSSEPAPASGCYSCDGAAHPAGAANVSFASGVDCNPCGPNLAGVLFVDAPEEVRKDTRVYCTGTSSRNSGGQDGTVWREVEGIVEVLLRLGVGELHLDFSPHAQLGPRGVPQLSNNRFQNVRLVGIAALAGVNHVEKPMGANNPGRLLLGQLERAYARWDGFAVRVQLGQLRAVLHENQPD